VFGDILRAGDIAFHGNGVPGRRPGQRADRGSGLAYGSAGFARSQIRVGVPFAGGLDVGDAAIALGDAGVEVRGTSSAVRPLVQLEAGMARYRVRHAILDIESTSPVWVGGAGVDVAVSRSLWLRLLVRDHVGALDLQEAIFLDIDSRTSHNVSFSIGLAFGF